MSVSAMKKLTVIVSRDDAETVVRKLMNLRCVEIRSTECGEGVLALRRMEDNGKYAEAERRLNEIRSALPVLNRYTTRKKGLGRNLHRVNRQEFLSDGRAERAMETVNKTNQLRKRAEELTAEQTRNENEADALNPWLDYDVPLNVSGSRRTTLILGAFPGGTAPETVCDELTEAGACPEVVSEDGNGVYVAVTCFADDEEKITHLLTLRGFVRANFRDVDTTAQIAFDRTQEKAVKLEAELFRTEEELRALADGLDDAEILCDIEETNRNTACQLRKLATTRNCAVLDGWVPVFMQEQVDGALERFACAYEIADPEEGEEPPVLLRNNRFAVNFEWVIGMYSYPKYGSFDPTFIMSIFYFLIFGLMFADVGYGLLLVLGCFGGVKLLNPKPGLKRMILMFGYCGISSMVMGLIFGGWFGDLPTAIMTNLLHVGTDGAAGRFFGSGLWFNPLDDPMTFLIISLAVGAVHLITGMIIKFVILCRSGQAKEAICTIAPNWVLFIGLGLLLVNGTVGKYVAIAGAALIILLNGYDRKNIFSRLLKGLGGIYGLINYVSDLLSYSRILALGLVAGVIAKVINLITMMGNSWYGFVIMLVILLAGHGLNLAINVLGSFVHTSRLQYIEFFGKFYEDGGTPFDPALPAENYTEDA